MNSPNPIKYSIVVPLYNEEQNVAPLYVRLTQVMTGLDKPYEIIFVDDGSRDQTLAAPAVSSVPSWSSRSSFCTRRSCCKTGL